MKKTMKKSALLSSVAMLIVSAIVLTSATYAWFSSSKVVSVTDLEASVKVTTGLLISVDKGREWGTSFEFDDAVAVKDGWSTAKDVEIFNPVSTANGNTWFAATYEDGALVPQDVNYGKDFVAVPLWVTGPAAAEVAVHVDFTGTDETAAKNAKFAILKSEDGETVSETYAKAIAADGSTGTFMGVSAAGSTVDTTENSAYTTDGGVTISEVGADGKITFTIDEGTSTDAPIKFIVFVWLEGNDEDCKMLDFDVAGEDIKFSMQLKIVE